MSSHFPNKHVTITLLLVCTVTMVFTASCNTLPTTHTSVTVLPTSTSQVITPLPAFTDWRVAYMGEDNHIHVITLDGKTDVVGPVLPFAPPGVTPGYGSQLGKAGFAADGHTLAYITDHGLVLIDPTSNHPAQIIAGPHTAIPGPLQWTRDGHSLIINDWPDGIFLVRTNDGSITQIPGTPFPDPSIPGGSSLDRWMDNTHILIMRLKDKTNGAPLQFYSLDTTTGTHTLFATLPDPPDHEIGATTFPDFTNIVYFYYTYQGHRDSTVGLYNVANGAITKLLNFSNIQAQNLVGIANLLWRPGTLTFAFCTGLSTSGSLKDFLGDPLHDVITPLPTIGYPVGWSPDGKTLIFSSDYVSGPGQGPFTLTALHFGDNGQMTQTVLTKTAMHFNFIGFIKTAN